MVGQDCRTEPVGQVGGPVGELPCVRDIDVVARFGGDEEKTRRYISENYTLYDIFEKFGEYQDRINSLSTFRESSIEFRDYDQFMDQQSKALERRFALKQRNELQRLYFYDVLYPFVFRSIRTSILEFQYSPAFASGTSRN